MPQFLFLFFLFFISNGSVEVRRITGGASIEIHFPAGTRNATVLPQKCVWVFQPGAEFYTIGIKDLNCVTVFDETRHIRFQNDMGITDFVAFAVLHDLAISAAVTLQESSTTDPEFIRVRRFAFAPKRTFEVTTESQHPLLSLAAQTPRPAWVMSNIPGDTHITQSWLFSPKYPLSKFNFSAHVGHRDLTVTNGALYDFMGTNMDHAPSLSALSALSARSEQIEKLKREEEKRDTFSVSCDSTDPTNCTLVISNDVCVDGECNVVTSESTWFWVAFSIFFFIFLAFGLWWAWYTSGGCSQYETMRKVIVVDAQNPPEDFESKKGYKQAVFVQDPSAPVEQKQVSSKYSAKTVFIRQPRYKIKHS
jgi:hypothetical protein